MLKNFEFLYTEETFEIRNIRQMFISGRQGSQEVIRGHYSQILSRDQKSPSDQLNYTFSPKKNSLFEDQKINCGIVKSNYLN